MRFWQWPVTKTLVFLSTYLPNSEIFMAIEWQRSSNSSQSLKKRSASSSLTSTLINEGCEDFFLFHAAEGNEDEESGELVSYCGTAGASRSLRGDLAPQDLGGHVRIVLSLRGWI